MTPVFLRITTPESKEIYGDVARIYSDNFELIFECPCRTHPNPKQPRPPYKSWLLAYAQICLGRYDYKFLPAHDRFKKCLIINSGGYVPTVNLNVNHGRHVADEIFVHCGSQKTWSGSAGCITIHPDKYLEYMSHFPKNSSGKIVVTDDINYEPGGIHERLSQGCSDSQ